MDHGSPHGASKTFYWIKNKKKEIDFNLYVAMNISFAAKWLSVRKSYADSKISGRRYEIDQVRPAMIPHQNNLLDQEQKVMGRKAKGDSAF